MFNMPDVPCNRGTYPNGVEWVAYPLDQGRVLVIESPGDLLRVEILDKKKDWHIKGLESLHYCISSFDRSEYPELMAWFDSHFSPEAFEALVKKHYTWSHKSWQALFPEEPITNLRVLKSVLLDKNQLATSLENSQFDSGEGEDPSCLRVIFLEHSERPAILIVFQDLEYRPWREPELTLIYKPEDLLTLMEGDSWTARRLQQDLAGYTELRRRIK